MTLYLVVNDDANGDNFDQFVSADTPEEAVKLLLAQDEKDRTDFDTPFRVFPVPGPTPFRGVIDWPDPVIVPE